MKIDIEGADFLALKGFDFERIRAEMVMVEFMDDRSKQHFGYTHHDMVQFMEKYDYTAIVSEWAEFAEYSAGANSPHHWIQCWPYPLGHQPYWGNLIFVQKKDIWKFNSAFERYMKRLVIKGRINDGIPDEVKKLAKYMMRKIKKIRK